ncbi:MAG: TIGR00282 family metallophosphoesterase [Candidatus Eisenbacteria bacterium]
MARPAGDGTVRILFLADVFGAAGRRAIHEALPDLQGRLMPDLVIANAENVAGGFGFTPSLAEGLLRSGVDVLTGGNHTWNRKEAIPYLDAEARVLRPANYPDGAPGRGHGVFESRRGVKVAVINLIGRVFMTPVECPFRKADRIVHEVRKETPVIFVDFHAEATSEKTALGRHLDGRVSAVVGTHTHVQTADERILPAGTAYITDAGMTGPHDGIIGVRTELVLHRYLAQTPIRFEPAEGDPRLSGVVVDVEAARGKAVRIERVHLPLSSR